MSKLYDVIKEEDAFQKTFSKKRRGRPGAFPDLPDFSSTEYMAGLPGTQRSKLNQMHGHIALAVVFGDGEADYRWVARHQTVMYELGRVCMSHGEKTAKALYRHIREHPELTARKALQVIRCLRMGGAVLAPSADQLTNAIVKLAAQYRAQGLSEQAIAGAIQRALDVMWYGDDPPEKSFRRRSAPSLGRAGY